MASPLNEMGLSEQSTRRNPTRNFGGDAFLFAGDCFDSKAEILSTVSTCSAVFTLLHPDRTATSAPHNLGVAGTTPRKASLALRLRD